MKAYDPRDWYWIDREAGEVYSSQRQMRVGLLDQTFLGWCVDGTLPSRHPGDEELAEVLAAYGLRLYPDDPLLVAKREKRAAAEAVFAQRQAAGIAFGGKVLQLREEDLPRITGAAVKAALALGGTVTWPPDFGWRMADNSMLVIATPQAMIQLADAAAGAYAAMRARLWAIKDAVEGAGTVEAVAAIDETAGWP